MSAFNRLIHNQQASPSAQGKDDHRKGKRALLGPVMICALLALLPIAVLLLTWQPNQVEAGPNAPMLEGVETTTVDTSSVTSLTIKVPSGTVEGDLLIATVIHGFASTTIVPPSGWEQIDLVSCESDRCMVGAWFRVSGGNEPDDYTFTWKSGERAVGAILRYSGADPDEPINASGSATGTSAKPTAPSVDTTVGGTKVLRIAGVSDDLPVAINPAGASLFAVESNHQGAGVVDVGLVGVDDLQPTAGETGSAEFSLPHDTQWWAVTIAIKPASSSSRNRPR